MKVSPRTTSVASWLQADIPVFVPCFNNRTYAEMMLGQLRDFGFARIVFVDNASSAADMQAWLAGLGAAATVLSLQHNHGPWHVAKDPRVQAMMPRFFCLTDPDIGFNAELPRDFLADLATLTTRERIGKAGFALDIHDRDALRDDLFDFGEQRMRIWDWEEKFWRTPLQSLAAGDPVYRAPIDTTFALYDREFYDPETFYPAVRVAGRFTARHLPWYRKSIVPGPEAALYADTAHFSNYGAGAYADR